MKSDYISDLIIIALLCVGYIYMNNRISEYQGETYLWKKLLGESEKKIVIEFQKKNILVESLLLLVFAVMNISGDILNWLISIINIVILINNILLLIFRRKYCRNISGKIFMIVAYIYFIWIFFTVIQAIVAGGEVYAIVIRIVKTKCIGGVAEVLKHPPISLFLINTIMCLYLVYTVSTYDNRVCSKANYKPKKWCISLSQNIIMILVIYAGYIFLAINISQNANVFSVITCIFAILLSGCIEDFFREDICNRQWYRLLGEKYSGLWCKKMMVELKIQFVVFAAYLICAFIHKYDVKIVFMVLIYMVECGLCWVTYFALYYVKMKKRYTTLEMMKLYAAMFSITVPGINILLCAWWYVRGARRWNEYVRDL